MRRCSKCKEYKGSTEFYVKHSECKKCSSVHSADWYKRNRETRQYNYRSKNYGLSKEEVDKLMTDQDGRCAACFNLPSQRGLVVDHDHATGKVRALLCHNCNSSLGYLKDDPTRVRLLLDYILKFGDL